jgi:hypothetical protein
METKLFFQVASVKRRPALFERHNTVKSGTRRAALGETAEFYDTGCHPDQHRRLSYLAVIASAERLTSRDFGRFISLSVRFFHCQLLYM